MSENGHGSMDCGPAAAATTATPCRISYHIPAVYSTGTALADPLIYLHLSELVH